MKGRAFLCLEAAIPPPPPLSGHRGSIVNLQRGRKDCSLGNLTLADFSSGRNPWREELVGPCPYLLG